MYCVNIPLEEVPLHTPNTYHLLFSVKLGHDSLREFDKGSIIKHIIKTINVDTATTILNG